MSVCHDSVVQEVRPGTARVQVTELSGSGSINPTPARKANQDQDKAVEPYLSPKRLELLCGTHDLSRVNHLEICVDTQENTLGDFGAYLPRLEQLKMNNSFVMSLRDLGTTLSHLQVLWMSHCCLQDLSGISTFDSLKELYLPYNNVSDLSQVAMLENLRLLDLEGNCVDDLIQIQYLGLCPNLQTLTLEGNPVSKRPNPASPQAKEYNYRAAVRELVPQLRYLDDVKVEEDKLTCCSTTQEDWDILRMSFQESNSFETAEKIARHLRHGAHITGPLGARPASSASMRPILATGRKLLSPPGSRPASSDSDVASVEAETSTLTHGVAQLWLILTCTFRFSDTCCSVLKRINSKQSKQRPPWPNSATKRLQLYRLARCLCNLLLSLSSHLLDVEELARSCSVGILCRPFGQGEKS
uniref:Leucine rich repeat containing 56 n=1 Tax=Poecilia mexicana TaxID=48701 RepID=A0A3B3XSQ7_9TELE